MKRLHKQSASVQIFCIALIGFWIALVGFPSRLSSETYSIVSDTFWTVVDPAMNNTEKAQAVCLNANSPSNCPTGATNFGYAYPGWTADLAPIQGAKWIWAPNLDGETSPAAGQEFTFRTPFYLCGPPSEGGTVWVAADNYAEVKVNGHSILTSQSSDTLSTAAVPLSVVNTGLNVLEVVSRNAANPPDCSSDEYNCNPAGFVLGASFKDSLSELPKCSHLGMTFKAGQSQTRSCSAPLAGTQVRTCLCASPTFAFWSDYSQTCTAAQPTCTGLGGGRFNINDVEQLPRCTGQQIGSPSHACVPDGAGGAKWGPTVNACADPPMPPRSCTSNGVTYANGTIESLCIAPESGDRSRRCRDGTWEAAIGTCSLPLLRPGDFCGNTTIGLSETCPPGTSCKRRVVPPRPVGPRPWWCFFAPNAPECSSGTQLQPTDFYCQP
jgi:hypothetical protein